MDSFPLRKYDSLSMKHIYTSTLSWLVLAILVPHAYADSPEAVTLDSLDAHYQRCVDAGEPLEIPPLVLTKSVKQGQIGMPTISRGNMRFKLSQKLSDNEGLVYAHYTHIVSVAPPGPFNVSQQGIDFTEPRQFETGPYLLRNHDLSGTVDGAFIEITKPITIAGSYAYIATTGAKTTVSVVETVDLPPPPKTASAVGVVDREWRSSNKNFSRTGKFVRYEKGVLTIAVSDKEIEIPLSKLHADDRDYVRERIAIDAAYQKKLVDEENTKRRK